MKILLKLFFLVVFLLFCITYLGSKIGMLLSAPSSLAVLAGAALLIWGIVLIIGLGYSVGKDIITLFEEE